MSALAKAPGFSRAQYHEVRCTYCLLLVNAYIDVLCSINVGRLRRTVAVACFSVPHGQRTCSEYISPLLRKFPSILSRRSYLFSLRRSTYPVPF